MADDRTQEPLIPRNWIAGGIISLIGAVIVNTYSKIVISLVNQIPFLIGLSTGMVGGILATLLLIDYSHFIYGEKAATQREKLSNFLQRASVVLLILISYLFIGVVLFGISLRLKIDYGFWWGFLGSVVTSIYAIFPLIYYYLTLE